jgi:rhodanese-related sulfurtransferase
MTSTTGPQEPIALRLVKVGFNATVRRDAGGVPRLPPEFVAEQGQYVRILDVRETHDLTGPLGHIPAVTHVPMNKIGDVPGILDRETCVVLVSNRGTRAGVAAMYLEQLGMKRVAAMEGGMNAWRALGFTTLRDPDTYRKQLKAFPPGIGRDGRPIVARDKGTKLTAREIQDHIGDTTSVRWVKLAAFLLHGKRSCVDGRDDSGVIGTPGGDAGELLLGMAAIENMTGRALDDAQVTRILEKHIDTFGRFYMHSDIAAMNRLVVDKLREDDRIKDVIENVRKTEEWREWLRRPPQAVRPALLEHLVKADVMGCGHLNFAMTDEAHYQVRPGLATAFLSAFHTLRWAGAPEMEWVVLGGEHVEGAVASIVVEGGLHSYTRVPLVSPMVAGTQMFVSHPQVTAFLRKEMATFFAQNNIVPAADEAALATAIDELGAKQMDATLTRLAKDLPIFELRFDLDGKASVKQVGVV